MKTEALLAVVVLLAALPWFTVSGQTVGIYADQSDTVVNNDSDVYDVIWQFSHVRNSLRRGTDPRLYGEHTLAWHNMPWPSLLAGALTGWGYSASLIISSLFAGTAGYFLGRSWGLGRNGALVAGIVIIWMPVRLIRVYQHYTLASTGFVLCVLVTVRRWLERGKLRYLLLSMPLSVLAVAEGLQHGFTLGLGWMLTAFFTEWKGWKRFLLSAVLPAAGAAAGFLWLLSFPEALSANPGMDWTEAVYWGAEIQSYFLPSLLGEPVTAGWMPNAFEGVVSPGLTVLLLGIIWCIREKKWKPAAAIGGVMLLSTGPLLKIFGTLTPVPLPYMLVAKTPFLSAARTPARLAVVAGFAAALGAGALIEKQRTSAGWLLFGLIILEIVPVPLKTIDTAIPEFYRSSAHSGPVLEIPVSPLIRRYSLFESEDGLARLVRFMAREDMTIDSGLPEGLFYNSATVPLEGDFEKTGAATVVYNRWMFSENETALYDSLYSILFTCSSPEESLWVWQAP
ncbi:hypothetical protein CSA37_05065 [Candidatus Fermentibacteria bacterium]|nr:MAG: hypothetical protein CSA37_10355 [Candidatus Fermentibacteria bacterium]PIE52299.1 MAG: hypothetical protein CSA37_07460 [Candidatus Fermentibacteria bacterium]PIE52794.1 MAG: hypothetical protein CSA37_05065 [Candidatus Fermentibacteria bacterium]